MNILFSDFLIPTYFSDAKQLWIGTQKGRNEEDNILYYWKQKDPNNGCFMAIVHE